MNKIEYFRKPEKVPNHQNNADTSKWLLIWSSVPGTFQNSAGRTLKNIYAIVLMEPL